MEPVNIQYSINALSNEIGQAEKLPVSSEAQKSFVQAMQTGDEANKQQPIVLGKADEHTTLGDKVLQGVQNVKSGYDEQVNAVQKSLESPDPLLVNDMLRLQMEIASFTLQGELMSKTVSKSTQNVDTLLKSQ